MEIVWHGNYPRYLEIARCALLDCIEYDYPRMRINYIKPLHFKQRICVCATLTEFENRLKIEFLITDAHTGEKLSKAYSIQVAVDMRTKEMCFVSPPLLREKLVDYQQKKMALNQPPATGLLS